jgi:putative component of membrane protein insertase Oxa1/YidC/SpoIIIJ protein YidD
MRAAISALILAYQRLAPRALRERCIFRESCSNFVLRTARERGAGAAMAAFGLRMRCCRPGYYRLPQSSMYPDIAIPVRLADGSIVDLSGLSHRVRGELSGKLSRT